MPEVDLTIVAQNQEFMKTMNESQKAEQAFYEDWQKNMDVTAEQHEAITKGMQDELKRLGVSEEEFLKKYKQTAEGQMGLLEQLNDDLRLFKKLKDSATTTEDIEKFNKKIGETQKQIEDLNKKGVKNNDTFSKLKSGFTKLFAVLGGGYLVMQGFNKLMSVSDKLNLEFQKSIQGARSGAVLFFNALSTGNFSNFFTNLKNAVLAGQQFTEAMNDIQTQRSKLAFEETKANVIYAENIAIIKDSTKSLEEVNAAVEKILTSQDELLKKRTDLANKAYDATVKRIAAERGLTEQQVISFATNNDKALRIYTEGAKKYETELQKIHDRFPDALFTRLGSAERTMLEAAINEFEKNQPFLKKSKDVIDSLNNIPNETIDEINAAYREIGDVKIQNIERTNRAQRRLNLLAERARKEDLKNEVQNNDDKIKAQEEFLKLIEDLNRRYREAQLEGVSGKGRIDLEEKFANEELDLLKSNLEARGKLTKEQSEMIEYIRNSIAKRGALERKKIDNEERINLASSKRELLDTLLQNSEDEIDLTRATEEEKLELKIAAYQKTIEALTNLGDTESLLMAENLKKAIRFMQKDLEDLRANKEFTIWKFLGIDETTQEGQDQIEGIKAFTELSIDSIGQIMNAEAQLAAQRRQNAENRLSELENQLQEELDLQEQGLANNVNAVKKEIEATKAEKEKALEQEKAIQKAQIALDTVTQISSLITASTKIFKATAGILPPFGQILAIAAIGTMFAFMTATKIKAAQAAKLEQGGYIDEYGVIQGKRHSEGGEQLTKHIEVEQGEGVGVFNRKATQFYGGMLPKWVEAINNRNFPKFDIRPEVKASHIFELDTSKMNSELKAIKNGIDNLNSNIINQKQTNHKHGVRIEKQGNRTRIVHEKN